MVAHAKDAHSRKPAAPNVENRVVVSDVHAKDAHSRRPAASDWIRKIGIPLITAITPIVIAYFTYLPSVLEKDSKIINELRQQMAQHKEQANTNGDSINKGATSTAKRLTISGWALDPKTNTPLKNHSVFLIPKGRYPEFDEETEPDGTFTFSDVPDQAYYIVVRAKNGSSSFGNLRPVKKEILLESDSLPTLLKYNFSHIEHAP